MLRTRATAGLALLTVLFAVLILMVVVAITMTMTMRSHRVTSSNEATTRAQYAAEAALQRGRHRLQALDAGLQKRNFDFQSGSVITSGAMYDLVVPLCQGAAFGTAAQITDSDPNYNASTPLWKKTCTPDIAAQLNADSPPSADRVNLLASYATADAYQSVLLRRGYGLSVAQAKGADLGNASLATRKAWWNNMFKFHEYESKKSSSTGEATQSSAADSRPNYETQVGVAIKSVEAYSTTASGNPSRYRITFKSFLKGTGYADNQTGSGAATRVLSGASADDQEGISWLEIAQPTLGVINQNRGCDPAGMMFGGNLPGILGVPLLGLNESTLPSVTGDGVENSFSKCHDGHFKSAITAGTGLHENFAPLSATEYSTYTTQFRGGFNPGEVINGDVFTNELWTFPYPPPGGPAQPGVTFNGKVSSAGCLTPLDQPPGSNCAGVRDAIMKNTGVLAVPATTERIYTNTMRDLGGVAGGNATNEQLQGALKQLNPGLSFPANNPPQFDAVPWKMFDPSKNATVNGKTLDGNIAQRYWDSRGIGSGGALSSTTGLNVDAIIRWLTPGIQPKSYADGKPGINAAVRIQAADEFADDIANMTGRIDRHPVSPTSYTSSRYNTGTSTSAQYQYIELVWAVDIGNQVGSPAYTSDGWMYNAQFRVCQKATCTDGTTTTFGQIEFLTKEGGLGQSPYQSVAPPALNKNFKWVPFNGFDAAGNLVTTKRPFNNVVFGEGNLQLTNADPSPRTDEVGAYSTLDPAVAANQRLDIVSAKNIYVSSDLVLQQRDFSANPTPVNALNLYSQGNVLVGSPTLPYVSDRFRAPSQPPTVGQYNIKLDVNVVTPNGKFGLDLNDAQKNMNGVLVPFGTMELTGSVTSQYAAEVGRYLNIPGILEKDRMRGYRRNLTKDPRIDASYLLGSSTGWSVDRTSNGQLSDISLRQASQ